MKIQFDKKTLENAIKSASLVVDKKDKISLLKNIELRAFGNRLLICSSNSKGVQLNIEIECTVKNEGYFLVNCEKFLKVLNSIDSGQYDLQFLENSIKINGIESNFSLQAEKSENFPIIENLDEVLYAIEILNLSEIFEKTLFCTLDTPSRYEMNGILFKGYENKIDFVATDTKRLAIYTIENFHGEVDCILNTNFCEIARKLVKKESCVLYIEKDKSTIKGKGFILSCPLVKGTFPDYKRAIPNCDNEIIVNREKLINTIKKLLPFTSNVCKNVKFKFSQNGLIHAFANTPESGEACYSLPFFNQITEEIEWNFNPDFMLDCLTVQKSKDVTLKFKDSKKPMMINGDSNYTQLIMPILPRE